MVDTEPKLDFYLGCLEEQVKCELQDSEATLTQSRTEGRVLLEIQEDSLMNLLEQLQRLKHGNSWSQEKEQMKREICCLKALLDEAQAKQVSPPQSDTEVLQHQLKKSKKIAQRVKNDLEQQTSDNRDLQLKLEALQTEKEALQTEKEALQREKEALQTEKEALQEEVQTLKLELQVEKQLRTVAESNLETTTHSLKLQLFNKEVAELEARSKAFDLEEDLAFERAQTEQFQKSLDKMKAALLKEKDDTKKSEERSQATQRALLEELRAETSKFRAALKKTEDQLERERLCFLQKKTSFKEEINQLKKTLKKMEEKLERDHLQWQQDKTSLKEENVHLKETLKKKEDQLQSDHLLWQQEKTSLLEDLEKSRALHVAQLDHGTNELVAAVKEVDLQLEMNHLKCQEERSSLHQSTDELMKTLQEKDQERERIETCMKARLEELERKVSKKKKWYRRFF